jgi:hypothetical protein
MVAISCAWRSACCWLDCSSEITRLRPHILFVDIVQAAQPFFNGVRQGVDTAAQAFNGAFDFAHAPFDTLLDFHHVELRHHFADFLFMHQDGRLIGRNAALVVIEPLMVALKNAGFVG